MGDSARVRVGSATLGVVTHMRLRYRDVWRFARQRGAGYPATPRGLAMAFRHLCWATRWSWMLSWRRWSLVPWWMWAVDCGAAGLVAMLIDVTR